MLIYRLIFLVFPQKDQVIKKLTLQNNSTAPAERRTAGAVLLLEYGNAAKIKFFSTFCNVFRSWRNISLWTGPSEPARE